MNTHNAINRQGRESMLVTALVLACAITGLLASLKMIVVLSAWLAPLGGNPTP